MIDRVVQWATVVSAVGCGAVGGLMLAFSVAVMPALGRRPAAEGMATMRVINGAILNPVFGLFFGGTTVACLVLAVTAPFAGLPDVGWRVGGALLYVAGAFLATMVVNVPLNNALDRAGPDDPDAARLWADYRSRWTAWNHVRAVAAIAAATVLTIVG